MYQLSPMFTSSPSPSSLSARSVPLLARAAHRSCRSCDSSISRSRMLWLSPSPLPRVRRCELAELCWPGLVLYTPEEAARECCILIGLEVALVLATLSRDGFSVFWPVEATEMLDGDVRLFLSFEPPNHRLFRTLPVIEAVSDSCTLSAFSLVAGSSVSTSSASLYHLRRRVYLPQLSWPRRPSCHYSAVS